MTKVSVIVPVYNPGPDIEPCIASLLAQSLPRDEYELIFVDDGSTDETPARLDALAAAEPGVVVRHIPNSGWPGRPRNIGMDLASGEFLYFVDNDDWLEPEALERLYERAVALDSDIVIGKVVGQGNQRVPRPMFTRNRDDVDLEWRPLLHLLSPHKLFRRSFIEEHGFRFPEGPRRLEDHVFVVHTYFHAKRISVLADYPCYHWMGRDNTASASRKRWDPVGYYENLREVLDLIDEHTSPGELRDRLKAHWYRGKCMRRMGAPAFLKYPDDYRAVLYREVRRVALERWDEGVDALLPYNLGVRSQLVRGDRYDTLHALAEWETALRADVKVRSVRSDGDAVVLDLRARLIGTNGPLEFTRRGDRVFWVPPADVAAALPQDALDVTDTLAKPHMDVILMSAENRAEFVVPAELTGELVPAAGAGARGSAPPDGTPLERVIRAQVRVDPAVAAAGSPLDPGEWHVRAEMFAAGFRAGARVRRLARDGGGRLSLEVQPGGAVRPRADRSRPESFRRALGDRVRRAAGRVRRRGR